MPKEGGHFLVLGGEIAQAISESIQILILDHDLIIMLPNGNS